MELEKINFHLVESNRSKALKSGISNDFLLKISSQRLEDISRLLKLDEIRYILEINVLKKVTVFLFFGTSP